MTGVRTCAIAVACAVIGLVPGALAAAGADPLQGSWRAVGSSIDGTPVGFPSGLSGRVSAVVSLPGRTPTEVVGTLGGIWEENGSAPWTDVTSASWPSTAIDSLAVDPKRPRVVYAGTGYDDVDDSYGQPGAGVLKSTDGGRIWTPLAGSERLMRGFAVTGLAVDPVNDRVLVAAANNGVFRSADGGRSWNEVLGTNPGSLGVVEVRLAVDPVTGEMLAGVAQSSGIAASSGSRTIDTGHAVYRSVDGGRSWRPYALDVGTEPGLVVAPGLATAHGHTYAYALDITGAGGSGLYTSSDGGRSWRRQSTDTETKASIGQLVVDPKAPTHAYFAQADGPFEYTWGTHTVQTITGARNTSPQFGDWRALAIGPAANGTRALYGGNDGGACFYDFATKLFTVNDAGLVSGLDYFGSAQSSTLELSGAQDLGIGAYLGGSSAQELYNADAYDVLIDQNHPRTYYASVYPPIGSSTFVVSHDAGTTWSSVRLPRAANDVFFMAPVQASGDPNVLILPEQNGTLYVSGNDGKSWSVRAINGLGSDYVTSVAAAWIPGTTAPVIYVGTGFGGVWRSTDLGAKWSSLQLPVPSGVSATDVVIDPSTSTGPGGEHVILALGVSAPQAYAHMSHVGAVLETSDSGASWIDISGSLSDTSVNALLLSGSTLLAGTDNGLEQYSNGSWSRTTTGFPNVRVDALFPSADGSTIFATTYGRGTLALTLVPPVQGGHGPSRPKNSTPPSILGVPVAGHTLTTTTGTWSGSPRPRYDVQWQRCRRRCVNITGATTRSYTLSATDGNASVRALVRASNRLGSRTSASAKVPIHARPISLGSV